MDRRSFLKTGGVIAAAALGTTESQAAETTEGGSKMLNVAMLSAWHAHAQGYARDLAKMPDVKITTVWDEDPDRGQPWAKELKAEFVGDLAVLLKRDDVEGVVIDAPTSMHADIMVAAAQAGKHIFTEKVMALTVAECNRVSDAVKAAGVKFCISFPYLTKSEVLYAKKAVDDGLLGTVTLVRVRVAHDGGCGGWLPKHFWDPKTCGGGAMMDLGAHPMYLNRYFGGKPVRILSSFTYMTGHEVEDNAVSLIEFEGGCIGVSETSFMATHSPFSLELSGTEGSLLVGGPDETSVRIRSKKLDSKGWVTPDRLPEPLPATVQIWVDGVLRGAPIPFGLEEGTQLTELMEYAYIAAREKRQVDIPARA